MCVFYSAYSGKFVGWKEEGVYNCVVCGNTMFSSDSKFDSKSGWPAFNDVVDKDKVMLKLDTAHGKYTYLLFLFLQRVQVLDECIFA